MAQSHEEVLQEILKAQKSSKLSIISLSELISGPVRPGNGGRPSDVSAEAFDNPSPASLEAELVHYRVSHCLSERVLVTHLIFF